MIKINFFSKVRGSIGFSAEQYKKNKVKSSYISVSSIIELSEVEAFNLPFSGGFVGDYAYVELTNGTTFFIKTDERNRLVKELKLN
jgi:hypothetical protein